MLGDGYCDDEANVEECAYDGGDCCDAEANVDYCDICQCYNDEIGTTEQSTSETTEGCPQPSWVGDLYCDDATNIAICDYDGGDCCLEEVQVDYCNECLCLDE